MRPVPIGGTLLHAAYPLVVYADVGTAFDLAFDLLDIHETVRRVGWLDKGGVLAARTITQELILGVQARLG